MDVVFPSRDQTFGFGVELNTVYRDQLRRPAVTTFVDLEGWIVWIQEYLRYRVNGCSNQEASFRVGVQIGGGGVPPVCAVIPPGVNVPFPPRNESFAFGLDLNATYRDLLRRPTVSAFVNLEGWIVWISEYLRYRTTGCSDDEASFRVGIQNRRGRCSSTLHPRWRRRRRHGHPRGPRRVERVQLLGRANNGAGRRRQPRNAQLLRFGVHPVVGRVRTPVRACDSGGCATDTVTICLESRLRLSCSAHSGSVS